MRRLLRFPLAAGRYAWRFVNPRLRAGRIPLGRLVISIQIIAALIFVGYTLTKKSIRLPFSAEAYEVQLILPDAQGLDRLDEPAAAVAGTPLGGVSEVEYQDGQALVTLTLEPEVRGKVFADASAAICPASALQNLLVNIDPGSPEAGPLPEDEPIPPSRTTSYVAIDELTGILDADTQAYVSILVKEAELALDGRGGKLREALSELGELAAPATRVSRALAQRRRLLTRLVGELEVVFETLSERGLQLASAIDAGNRTLAVTAAREAELAEATRALAPVLAEAERSVAALRDLAEPLAPALERLAPSGAPLTESLARLRGLLPRAERLTDQFEELVAEGARPVGLMVDGTRGLTRRARKLVPVSRDLAGLSKRFDRYKEGVQQTADTLSGAFSAQDRNGAYGAIDILKIEAPKPENFGFGSESRGDRSTEPALETGLARALELLCRRDNALACLFRFNVPGLPDDPVTRGRGRHR